MAHRDLNQDSLEAFNQEDAHIVRNKRRSSILKPVLENHLPEDRRQSRRISFHTNILCQQILPDGTTQVVTEALKAKQADSSVSTVSNDSRPSLPADKSGDEENCRKRTASSNSAGTTVSGLKKRKDPKVVAQSYQNFIRKTYDAADDNDYDTVFNTSVNRNGFPVAPRDQRVDVTRLFAVDQTEGVMDITRMSSHVQDENDVTAASTRIFTDTSMSLEGSLLDAGNVSEMDTAMIIEDDVFENSDEKEASKEHEPSPTKRICVQMDQTLVPAVSDELSLILPEPVPVVPSPEPVSPEIPAPVVIEGQESIIDISMSIVSEKGCSAEGILAENTKVFDNNDMEVTEAMVHDEEAAKEQEKTQLFGSQNASISVEKNSSKDISPASSQEPVQKDVPQPRQSLPSSQVAASQKDTDLFQDKSTSFRNNKALTLAFSRVSFPRNLDKVLKLRREQMNRTLQTLKDTDISSDTTDSYSESPQPVRHRDSSVASVHFPDKSSLVFEQTAALSQNCTVPDAVQSPAPNLFRDQDVDEPSNISADMDAGSNDSSMSALAPDENDIAAAVVPESTQSPSKKDTSHFLSSSSSPETETQLEATPQESRSKGSTTSHFLSTLSASNTFDSSDSDADVEHSDMDVDAEDEDGNNLLEDSLHATFHEGDSSHFLSVSPDSSFHSSFISRDLNDTLMVLDDQINEKLMQVLGDDFKAEENVTKESEVKDKTYVPLSKFDAEKHGAVLDTGCPDQLNATFLYSTIRFTVDLGETLRCFNGIPIKAVTKIGIQTIPDYEVQDDHVSLVDYTSEKMKPLIGMAHDMLVSAFDERKSTLLSTYATSDQLTDLLSDISDLVKVSSEFLQELALTSKLYPMQVVRKVENTYDLAFQLPGRRRNFFLILCVDPSTYPFTSMRVRFGFVPEDRPLYHVTNFAKALSMVVKPGKHHMSRMIEAAKMYVGIIRKFNRSKQ